MLFLVLPVFVVALVWIGWRIKHRKLVEMSREVPGPKSLPLLGDALAVMVPPEELVNRIQELRQKYGDFFRIWLGPDLNYFVSDPDDVKSALSTSKTCAKGPQYKYMKPFIGEGILSGSGPIWRYHRKVAQPNFGGKAVESFTGVFNKELDVLIEGLREVPEGKTIDIFGKVVRATTYSVCQAVMGLSREQSVNLPHLDLIMDRAHEMYSLIFQRMTTWYLQIEPAYWFTNLFREQVKFKKALMEMTGAIYRHRVEALKKMDGGRKQDLLHAKGDEMSNTEISVVDRFILSGQFSPEDVMQESFTIFTASQEATAKLSSFLILMMAFHPDCQEKLYQEIKAVVGDDEEVNDEHFKQMPYLEMVYKEVLRLFPIGVMLQRTVMEDIKISHGTIPAGSSLVVPILHMQRDKRFWDHPDSFDPERFTPENSKLRNPNCYMPYSMGPMDCLGRHFGKKLIKTVSVRILRDFKFTSPQTYEDMKIVMAISASPIDGYPVMVTPRK